MNRGEELKALARQRAAELGLKIPSLEEQPTPVTHDPDLIPDIEPYERSQEDQELDALLDGIDILDAYQRWCPKASTFEIAVGSKRESIMVRCPAPDHEDRVPSAWLNLDKQVWTCGACGFRGGDKYDIAAWHFGYSVPGYKHDAFPELRRAMATDLGYTVIRTAGREWVEPPATVEIEVEPAPDAEEGEGTTPPALTVLTPDGWVEQGPPALDWRAVFPEGTFLRDWMEATCELDLPEEYFAMLGLQMVALAIGDDAVLESVPNIEPNLFVCLVGPSGIGKSRATRLAVELLRTALPYEHSDADNKGVLIPATPTSGESLLKTFSRLAGDPSDPDEMDYRQVRALVRYDEFASLAGRGARAGSTLKPQIMSLFDGDVSGDLALSRESTTVENPYCCMVSTTQNGLLRSLITGDDVNSGFVNRWIFAMGPAKPLAGYYSKSFDLSALVMPLKRIHAWSAFGRRMQLTGDVLDAWLEFFRAELEPIKTGDDSSVMSRCDLLLMKMLVLLAANEEVLQPTVAHVEAVKVIWEWMKACYVMIGAAVETTEMDFAADEVIEAILYLEAKFGQSPSARDLWERRLKKRLKNLGRDGFAKALALLRQLGMVEEIEQPAGTKGGRPTVRYRVTGRGDGAGLSLTDPD